MRGFLVLVAFAGGIVAFAGGILLGEYHERARWNTWNYAHVEWQGKGDRLK